MDGERIKEIRADGLVYVDDSGAENFIDFSQCYERYVEEETSPHRWEMFKEANYSPDADFVEYISRIRNSKQVGRRQIMGPPWADGPYIEFYTNPPVRFDFQSEELYRQVRDAIRKLGWQTFDQS